MDWHNEIRNFQRLEPHDLQLPVSPHEAADALARYNKALVNLRNDSEDIARIELKKLCATIPSFGQAFLLFGCTLMLSGSPADAEKAFRKAAAADMPDGSKNLAELYASAALAMGGGTEPVGPSGAARNAEPRVSSLDAHAMTGLVRPSRKSRRRLPVANVREKAGLLKEPDSSPASPEHSTSRSVFRRSGRPAAFPRILAAVVLAVAVIVCGILYLPGLLSRVSFLHPGPTLSSASPTPSPDFAERLAWLLSRIETLRQSGQPAPADLKKILEDFNSEFPDAAISIPPDPSSTPVPATPTPAETSAAVLLRTEAGDFVLAGQRIAAKDAAGAADLLVGCRTALSSIPSDTTADGVTGTASQVLSQVEALLSSISGKLLEAYRSQGLTLFNSGDYAGALPPFLKAYAIDPLYYSGWIAYYCGRCDQLTGNFAAARGYFLFVVDHFPGRDVATKAQTRLDQLASPTP